MVRGLFTGRPLLLLLVVLIAATPVYPVMRLGCPYGCRHYGYDVAHCVEYIGALGNMNTCEEVQICYRDAAGGWYCDQATCTGNQCYYV